MFDDAFVKLDFDAAAPVIEEINPALTGGAFDAARVTILRCSLSFYPGYDFLDIADYQTIPHFKKRAIYKPGNVHVLDWSPETLRRLNETIPVQLDDANITDYVRFYYGHVRGPDGRFKIIETIDDMPWAEDPPPAARKAVGKILSPLRLAGKERDLFRVEGAMMFRDALYGFAALVSPDGAMTITAQNLLLDSLPVADDTLDQ